MGIPPTLVTETTQHLTARFVVYRGMSRSQIACAVTAGFGVSRGLRWSGRPHDHLVLMPRGLIDVEVGACPRWGLICGTHVSLEQASSEVAVVVTQQVDDIHGGNTSSSIRTGHERLG